MSDEDLSLGVSVDGVDVAVGGLSAVAAAEKRLEDATLRAAKSLSTENVAAFQKARAEYNTLKGVADQVAKSQTGVATATKSTEGNLAKFGSTVGMAGQAVGRFNSGLGSVVTGMGTALGAVQSMTTVGMGPLGIAVAAVSTVIGLASTAMDYFATRQAEAAQKMREQILPTLEDLISKANEAQSRLTLRSRLANGGGSYAEQGAYAEEARNYAQRVEQQLREKTRITNSYEEIAGAEELRRELDRANQVAAYREQLAGRAAAREGATARDTRLTSANAAALRQVQFAAAAEETSGSAGFGRENRSGGRGAAPAAVIDSGAVAEEAAVAAHNNALANMAQSAQDRENEIIQKGLDERRQATRDAAEESIRDRDELNASNLAAAKRAIAKEIAARRKAADTMIDIGESVGAAHTLLSSIIDAQVGSSAASKKKAIQAEAALTVVDSGVKAAVQIAEAAGSYPDVAGMISHGASAAGFVVAATRAAIVAGGGGGSAGSGTPSAAAQAGGDSSSKPSAFDRPVSASPSSSGPSRVVYQIGGPGSFPLATEAELGRTLIRFDRIGRRAIGARV